MNPMKNSFGNDLKLRSDPLLWKQPATHDSITSSSQAVNKEESYLSSKDEKVLYELINPYGSYSQTGVVKKDFILTGVNRENLSATFRKTSSSSRIPWVSNWIDHRQYHSDVLGYWDTFDDSNIRTSKHLLPEEKPEFVRFYWALRFYYMIIANIPNCSPRYSMEYYWKRSITDGPAFTDELKDEFAYSYRVAFGTDYDASRLDRNYKPLLNYNDLFPYMGLLKFNENVDDYLVSMEANEPIEDSDLQSLKEVFIQMFRSCPNELELISKDEISRETSTSRSFDDENKKTVPHYTNKNGFSSLLVGKRSIVPVYPGGVRDTITLTRESLNTVQLLERQMRHFLEYIEESAITLNSSSYRQRLEKIKNVKGYHFLRDIKKCGLSFPIDELLPAFISAGKEAYPDNNDFWDTFKVYNRKQMYLDTGEVIFPKRGYFLGMANHLATFMLIGLHRLAMNELEEEYPEYQFNCCALLGNDDSDIVVTTKGQDIIDIECIKLYQGYHETVLKRFSVWRNHKKSFISAWSLFYENYEVEGFVNKSCRLALVCANAILLGSIRNSKSMLSSFLLTISDSEYDINVLMPVISKISFIMGYEFYPDEIFFPYELGGWFPLKKDGLSECLYHLPQLLEKIDARYAKRIIDYIIETDRDRMVKIYTEEVKDYKDNLTQIAKILGFAGVVPEEIRGLLMTKDSQVRAYKRIEKNQNLTDMLVKQEKCWKRYLSEDNNDTNFEKLNILLAKHYESNIPPWMTKSERDFIPESVNCSWFNLKPDKMANENIKKEYAKIFAHTLYSFSDTDPPPMSWHIGSEINDSRPDYTYDNPECYLVPQAGEPLYKSLKAYFNYYKIYNNVLTLQDTYKKELTETNENYHLYQLLLYSGLQYSIREESGTFYTDPDNYLIGKLGIKFLKSKYQLIADSIDKDTLERTRTKILEDSKYFDPLSESNDSYIKGSICKFHEQDLSSGSEYHDILCYHCNLEYLDVDDKIYLSISNPELLAPVIDTGIDESDLEDRDLDQDMLDAEEMLADIFGEYSFEW